MAHKHQAAMSGASSADVTMSVIPAQSPSARSVVSPIATESASAGLRATVSNKATVPNDCLAPVIARSNPWDDLRPFIENLWCTREGLCRDIFPDDFPHPPGRRATKKEEDSFLLKHFSHAELHTFGAKFIKQALYAIAAYNQQCVWKFTDDFIAKHSADHQFYSKICGEDAPIRSCFDEVEASCQTDTFLNQVRAAVQNRERFRVRVLAQKAQTAEQTTSSIPADELPLKVLETAEFSGVKGIHGGGKDESDQIVRLQPPTDITKASNEGPLQQSLPPHLSVLPSDVDSSRVQVGSTNDQNQQSNNTELSGQALQERSGLGSNERSDTSIVSHRPQVTSYPVTMSSENHQAGRIHPATSQGYQGYNVAGSIQSGPRTVMLATTAPMENHLSSQYFSGPSFPLQSPGFGTSMPVWPEQPGTTSGHPQDYYYQRGDPRHLRHHGHGRSPPQHRFAQEAPLSSANMDPDSFRRLSIDQSSRQPNAHTDGRHSLYSYGQRHSSMHSSGERFSSRGTMSEMHNKRVFSDQNPLYQPSAFDMGLHEARTARGQQHKRRSTARNLPYNGRRQTSSGSVPTSSDNFIENGRNDVDQLILTHAPPDISPEELNEFLSQHANVRHVSVPRSYNSGSPAGNTNMFVYFFNTEEARRVLARRDLFLKGHSIYLRVPMRFLSQNPDPHPRYQMPRGSFESNAFPYGSDPQGHPFGNGTVQHGNLVAHDIQYHGPNLDQNFDIRAYPGNLTVGNPLQAAMGLLPEASLLVLGANTTRPKKGGGKNKKKRPLVPDGRPELARQRDGGSNLKHPDAAFPRASSTSTGASAPKTRTHKPVASVGPHKSADTQIAAPSEGASSVSEVFGTESSDTVENIPSHDEQGASRSPTPTADGIMTALVTRASNKSIATLDKRNAHSAKATPHRATALSSSHSSLSGNIESTKQKSTPDKAAEDVDESFQTAAETPESSRSISLLSSSPSDNRATAPEHAASIVNIKEASEGPKHELEPVESVYSTPRDNEIESLGVPDNTKKSAEASGAHHALKRYEAKTGPSQTESLSPFARGIQGKKKEKSKAQKKRLSGRSNTSAPVIPTSVPSTRRHDDQGISPADGQENIISSSSPRELVLEVPLTSSSVIVLESGLDNTEPKAPPKGLLNRIIDGALGLSKGSSMTATPYEATSSCEPERTNEIVDPVIEASEDASVIEHTEQIYVPNADASAHALEMFGDTIQPLDCSRPDLGTVSHSNIIGPLPPQDTSIDGQLESSIGCDPDANKKSNKSKKRRKPTKGHGTVLHVDDSILADDISSTAILHRNTSDKSRSGSIKPSMLKKQAEAGFDAPETFGRRTGRKQSTSDETQRRQVSSHPHSVEYSLNALDKMLVVCDERLEAEVQDEGQRHTILKSVHKMKQLEKEERVRKFNSVGDKAGADAVEEDWAQYVSQFEH